MVREHSSAARREGPVRTCVGCRERAAQHDLLRVVATESESGLAVTPDLGRRAPGRGAYVHLRPGCLDLALRRRAFARALKVTERLDSEQVQDIVSRQQEN